MLITDDNFATAPDALERLRDGLDHPRRAKAGGRRLPGAWAFESADFERRHALGGGVVAETAGKPGRLLRAPVRGGAAEERTAVSGGEEIGWRATASASHSAAPGSL